MKAFYLWYAVGLVVCSTMLNYSMLKDERQYNNSGGGVGVYRGASGWHK